MLTSACGLMARAIRVMLLSGLLISSLLPSSHVPLRQVSWDYYDVGRRKEYHRSRELGACLGILLVRMGFPFCLSYRYT